MERVNVLLSHLSPFEGELQLSASSSSAEEQKCEFREVLYESKDGIALITLNRPKALNALGPSIIDDIKNALAKAQEDNNVRVVIVTGAGRAFAAGADIVHMSELDYNKIRIPGNFIDLLGVACDSVKKPIIAAVNGFAFGGGCEFAMMCDIIIAAKSAKFGQPEVKIGTIPGAGGTQRLVRAIGKSRAMELVLTGNTFTADQALEFGLVSRVVPDEDLLKEAYALATQIASLSAPVIAMAKECVNRSFETTLAEGNLFERRMFHSTFALEDRKEGMTAFASKPSKKPVWKHQ
eukprot:TRINITY_DN7934_c0_g1_i1.p2 TRINITY_DN7934_c0_g1~~TRINITY_DN7934_c0_g1_i1.p2  ORF type:complete len:293 (+),score=136.39 TRINITY_DN7934_c0_g1_i1:1-879(+)